ncbi:FAD-dependent oxidoreductase domain-containing protein 1-like [Leptidea sinapis]|uniref:FAD-dependent oxidoreductase domain-containing protein 1-like n=1 Tax=Leptidea sinapis TaxID=189913 RepID=UPI00212594AB|nr:FAD-dependent oxidoreductase domain-containing protein 1-like [Leptidea sinapis]
MNKNILINRFVSFTINKRRGYFKYPNPFKRTLDALSINIKNEFIKNKSPHFIYPEHTDVVIIGGGFIGSSAAFWIKQRTAEGMAVVVIDKDLTFKGTPRNLSQGVLSQHFSQLENIQLSQFSAQFLRKAKQNLNKNIDIQFYPHGYLVLASDKYADNLEKNSRLLTEFGVKNELLSSEQIKKKYPYLNTNDVKLGCLSSESEGVFNANSLLNGYIEKSLETGAKYIDGEVIGFETEDQQHVLMQGVKPMTFKRLTRVAYKTKDGEERFIKFALCIVAAGAESSNIAKLAKIGVGDDLLSVPLPIQKREFNVYSLEGCTGKDKPGLNTPIIMDTSGLWLKRNGLENNLICGQIPLIDPGNSLQNNDYYEQIFKPSLQNRFPTLSNGKIEKIQKEEYDCNTFDDSGILGPHPYHNNLILATGFGRLGVPHSPGIGRAISDLIIDSRFSHTDLTPFSFDRLLLKEPFVEFSIY